MIRQTARNFMSAASMIALLSACAVGPGLENPAAMAAQPPTLEATDIAKKVDNDWWRVLGSAKLDHVMREAIAGNLDLAAADATTAQAHEAVTAIRGGLYPQVDLAAEAGRQRTGASRSNFYAVGPLVSFDFDIFGGTQRRIEAQTAFADAEKHRFDAAYLTLTGDVASKALLLASTRAQIDALQILLAHDRKNLELIRIGHKYGSATQVEVALATTQLAQDETLLPQLAQQRDSARLALSVLAGKEASAWLPPEFDLADFALPVNIPARLPSEIARHRPDILEAEAHLHAASAAVGIATADLYPRLELSASFSKAGPGIGTLWNIASGLTAPIFHGGTLKANQRASVEGYKASLADYQHTIIKSLGQVADILQAINHDAEEYAAQERALNAADASLRLTQSGYRAGEISVLQVLDAERAYQRALLGHIRARTAQHLDVIQLSVALGGRSGGTGEAGV